MKTPTFLRETVAALVLSVLGAVIFNALQPFLGSGISARVLLVILSLSYLLFFLVENRIHTGKFVTSACWMAVTSLLVIFNPPIGIWIPILLGLHWSIRGFYRYHSLTDVFADFLLCGFALAAAFISASHTHSVFLSLWVFLLVQALYVFLPTHLSKRPTTSNAATHDIDRFETAHRNATAALQRLSHL